MCSIAGIFEGNTNNGRYHVQILNGSNGRFGTIRVNGVFLHHSRWGNFERKLVADCTNKVETWQTQKDRMGYGFLSVHGTISDNGQLIQNMDR